MVPKYIKRFLSIACALMNVKFHPFLTFNHLYIFYIRIRPDTKFSIRTGQLFDNQLERKI